LGYARLAGILAIGEGTADWITKRSPTRTKVIPFAYFLKAYDNGPGTRHGNVYRFIYVGSLIDRKQVDLMLSALGDLLNYTFEVEIVGEGPNRADLEQQAQEILPGRTVFLGSVAMSEDVSRIAAADCLVLPSAHDGWGAVVSEAQICGTPVICSSKCGSSGTVRASGLGAVFVAGNVTSLRQSLNASLVKGRVDEEVRRKLREWATCLTAQAGAQYLLEIIGSTNKTCDSVIPPWERENRCEARLL